MRNLKFLAIVIGIFALTGCSKDNEESTNVSGAAVKGYVGSAKVDIYQYTETGVKGNLLASTTTDIKGNYSVMVNYRGPVEVVVSNGTYLDEATGSSVNLQDKQLRSISVLKNSNMTVAVTALTTISAAYVDAHASAGIETAVNNANTEMTGIFGLSGIILNSEIPADLTFSNNAATHAQIKYGAVQAGLSQYVKENNLSADVLITLLKDMGKDFSDGKVDGKTGSVALETTLTITPQKALQGLNIAIENFLKSARNKSGATSASIEVYIKTS
ncbi:hypothetical protein BH23BAC1_BH23BAC1_17340 [soil metagenome]